MKKSSTSNPKNYEFSWQQRRSLRRPLRIAETLREEIADIIENSIWDPRLHNKWITITETKVSTDLTEAKVYFSTPIENANITELEDALRGAAPYIRTEISHRLQGGFIVPKLKFLHDDTIQTSEKIENLIDLAASRRSND